jgi:uncharacterized membrane protein YeaQ/YmgE (transglycosylase-associated protein family)
VLKSDILETKRYEKKDESVNLSISEIIVWLIVGLLAGTVIGRVVRGKKEGFGVTANLGIGLVGAMIGGFLFNLFRIDFGMSSIQISLQDIVSACAGSVLFLVGLWGVKKYRAKPAPTKPAES